MAAMQPDFQCLYCDQTFHTKRRTAEHISTVHRDVTIRRDARNRPPASENDQAVQLLPPTQVQGQQRQQPASCPPAHFGDENAVILSLAPQAVTSYQGYQQGRPPAPSAPAVSTALPVWRFPPAPQHSGLPPPTLPPLPASISNLGLSAQDFDPLVHYHHTTTIMTIGTYIDIPASYAIPDEHMFNACLRKILGFGNLLRLATRYSNKELVINVNACRPTAAMTQSMLYGRLKRALEWAAGKEGFPGTVEEVRAWFGGERRARGTLVMGNRQGT